MASKQVTLAVGAVLFTALNLLVLAANWSITAHAKVAGRSAGETMDARAEPHVGFDANKNTGAYCQLSGY
jgi:hypothetical protein